MAREIDAGGAFRAMRGADPGDAVDTIAMLAGELGATDVVVYLVDYEQKVLEPLPDRSNHEELPHTEDVVGTLAGRAFLHGMCSASRSDGTRVFVPIVEGSDATGVLAFTVAEADGAVGEQCENLGILAGYLIGAQARVTDFYNLHRRRKSMSLAATMQWDLLPPLTLTSPRASVAAMLEPAYEVGGDCFDYALNGSGLDLAMMDAMGHGLHSAMVAGLAMSSYRHDRREARTLELIDSKLDSVVADEGGEAFVTGQAGHLDLETGTFSWINAGHPPPLLLRDGQAPRFIDGAVSPPWGVGGRRGAPGSTSLETGDSILFYTDGVTEIPGRKAGAFGRERLSELVGGHAANQVPIGLIVRHIIAAVVEHHESRLRDDAAVLMVKWLGPPAAADGTGRRS